MAIYFIACWDGECFPAGKVEKHSLTWFSKGRGYSEENIAKLKTLKPGQIHQIEKGHVIVRV
jgi:hypothetical protein